MPQQIFTTLKIVALALVLSFGLSYALAWTSPTATPPGNNVAAPLNASATDQTKTGGITAGSLTTSGLTTTGTLKVTTGAGAAKVLTSDATGNATWQAAAGGSDNLGNHTATQALSLGTNNIVATGADTGYGALTVQGEKGGFSGINFKNAAGTVNYGTVMVNATNAGFYNAADTSWLWYTGSTGDTYQIGTSNAADVYSRASGQWMSALQPRVTGTCPVGSAVRVVNANGTVTCGTFSGTAVYQEATVAPLVCDGTTCATGCGGKVTFASTCSAVNACTAPVYWDGSQWLRRCATSQTTYNNTLKGKLVP